MFNTDANNWSFFFLGPLSDKGNVGVALMPGPRDEIPNQTGTDRGEEGADSSAGRLLGWGWCRLGSTETDLYGLAARVERWQCGLLFMKGVAFSLYVTPLGEFPSKDRCRIWLSLCSESPLAFWHF